jgi:hypothetical protein
MNIVYDASDYYEQIEIDEDALIYDYRVVDPASIRKEQASRHDLDFYPFTRQELLKAGESNYVERNSHFMNLFRYVLSHYEIDRSEADFFVEDCVDAAKNGDSLASILEVAQSFLEMPDIERMSAITDLIVPLMNNTKQWVIKGYAPVELSAKRASAGVLLNAVPNRAGHADVIDMKTKQKVGRNDPCPCGSGKKFKKCCGQ